MEVFWTLLREHVLWKLLSDDSNKSMNLHDSFCQNKYNLSMLIRSYTIKGNTFHNVSVSILWKKKMFYIGVIVQYNSNLVITARNWRGMIWTQHQLLFWISQCWRSMHEKKKPPMCKNINLILTLSLCSSNWEYAIYLYPRAALERHNFTYLDGAIKRKEGKCKLTALSQGNFACNWLTGLH